MSCSLIKAVQIGNYSSGNTYTHIRAGFVDDPGISCDTIADLPAQAGGIPGYYLEQGSTAHVIADNTIYTMNSAGVWMIQDEASRMDVYTKSEIDSKFSDYTTTAQQMLIDGAQDTDIDNLLDAAAELIDTGNKNLLLLSGSNVTGYGIQCTFDAAAGTITLDGINPDKKCTGSFNVQAADSRALGLVPGTVYNFSCGGYQTDNDTIGLYVYTAGATPSQFDCYNNRITAWQTAWEQSSGFRLFIRSGTVVDSIVLKPMICAQAYYKISDKFVPHK